MRQMIKASGIALLLLALFGLGRSITVHQESVKDDEKQPLLLTPERRAAIGDFAKFNELFQNAKILIPGSFNIKERIFIGTLDLTLTNIRCFDISIGDILLSHTQVSNQVINLDVNVQQLDLTCELDYTYKYGILPRGDGRAKVFTDNNVLATVLGFRSSDFNTQPPSASSALSCDAAFEITNIDFTGDFVSDIVEFFERFIRDTIEREIEGVACEELSSLGTTFVGDILTVAEETLANYEGDLGPSVTDPLYLEQTFEIPTTLNALDLQDNENTLVQWFNQALDQADNLLGVVVPDPNGPSLDGRDLGANKLIRDSLLNENRELVVDIADLPIDAIIFQGHDQLTETTITMNEVKVIGLDSLTLFNPLDRIGKYTLQTEIIWESLVVEFDVTVAIKPSSKEDRILQGSSSNGIVENILIDFGVNDIAIDASLFMLVDEDILSTMKIGPLLQTDNIIPCVLSLLHTLQLSGLDVNPQLVNAPTLTGFISPGIDRIVSNSALAVFDMYQGVLKNALPNIFQTSVRDFVNKEVINAFLLSEDMSTCPSNVQGSGELDFRDLLLPPEEAVRLGASGTEPYGDLAYTAFDLLKDNLLSTDENGLLDLNSFLIDPVTESQSGSIGTIQIPSDLITFSKTDFANDYIRSFVSFFEIGLSNLRVNNLNILKPPVSILEATESPHLLRNVLTMGPVSNQPLEAVVRFRLNLNQEGGSPLEMSNEVDLSVSFDSASIAADMLAKISSSKFLSFPLRDILEVDCWLATITPPLLSESGFRLVESDTTLALPGVAIGLSGLGFGVDFVSSNSEGIQAIPELIGLYQNSSASFLLLERMNEFIEEFLASNMIQQVLDRSLVNAPKRCPHHPEYDNNFDSQASGLPEIPFPDLSLQTIDSLFYGAALVIEMAFLTFTEEKRLEPTDTSNELSSENDRNEFENAFDWTNLEGQGGSLVQSAIDAATSYLAQPSVENGGRLGINRIVGDWVLNGTSQLTSIFEDISFELPGVRIALHSLNITGLDSFSELDLWNPVSAQTIHNRVRLEKLEVMFGLDVYDIGSSSRRQRLSVGLSIRDIQAEIDIFLAMGRSGLENIAIGSMLSTENIVSCLLSAVDVVEITKIGLTIGEFSDPSFEGLLPDSQLSIDTFTKELMDVFRPRILESMPKVFDTTVKSMLNGLLVAFKDNEPCPAVDVPPSQSPFIEFNQLFNEASDEYGDLPSLLRNVVDSELIALDVQTQQPRINRVLIEPFTLNQSGIEGKLAFEGELLSIVSKSLSQLGIETIEFGAKDTSVENLNTIVQPLEILSPSTKEHVLDNALTLSNAPRTLRLATDAVFSITGARELSFYNKLKLSVDLGGAEFLLSLLAKLDRDKFLRFPLSDLTNGNCLFSLFARTLRDENGILLEGASPSLAIETIFLSVPSMNFQAECTNCTSRGLSVLPELMDSLNQIGTLDLLQERVVDLGLELVQSDFTQAYINRFILDGELSCPHSDRFQGGKATSGYPVPSFPNLPYKSMETIAFAASAALGVGTVIIAESHSPDLEQEFSDPSASDGDLEGLADFNLLDFSALETSIGEWADSAITTLMDYLTTGVDGEMRINGLLRSAFLTDGGILKLEFDSIGIAGEDSEIALRSVHVSGLDSIDTLSVLEATAPQELQNSVQWKKIGLDIVIGLSGKAEDKNQQRDLQEANSIKFSLELSDVDLSMALLLAIDTDLLGSLKLGSMVDVQNIFPCLVSTARLAKMKELRVSVGAISDFAVTGFTSPDIDAAIFNLYDTILTTYGDSIIRSMPNLFDTTIKALVNNLLESFLTEESNVVCPTLSFQSTNVPSFMDLRDLLLPSSIARAMGGSGLLPYGDLFARLLSLAEDLIFSIEEETGLSKVNSAVIGPLTRSQSEKTGTLLFPGQLFSGGSRIRVGGLDANVQLVVGDAWVENLDTVGPPLQLLAPLAEPHVLNNTVTLAAGDQSLNTGIRLLFSLVGEDDMQLRNDVNIQLDLLQATFILRTFLKIASSTFRDFPLRDTLNLNCWMATIPAPSLDNRGVRVLAEDPTVEVIDLAASIAGLNFNITCNECSSPRMAELTELLGTSTAQADATDLVNTLLDLGRELLTGQYLQVQIDRALSTAAKKCPHHPDFDAGFVKAKYDPFVTSENEDSISFLVLLGAVTMGLVVALALLMVTIRCIVRRRHRRFLGQLSEEKIKMLLHKQEQELLQEQQLNDGTHAMVSSPDIPLWIRWSMPVIILGNIAFFLSGHLSLGATVNIVIEFAGEQIVVEKFFEFSMARSTVDIWNAGGKELAILILIFSGIWPYTKQIMTLVLWFVPPSRVSASRRGSILVWLDWLAKWSMIDIFVLVISIVAFRVSIQSPEIGFLPPDFYSVDLLVVPLWGLYANMIAQLISQISSHFIIHYHRRIVTSWREQQGDGAANACIGKSLCEGGEQRTSSSSGLSVLSSDDESPSSRLHEHSFGRPHRGEKERLIVRHFVNRMLYSAAFLLLVLITLGSVLPSFSLKIYGLIGLAVESGQSFVDATKNLNIFSVVKLLMEEAKFLGGVGDWIGLGTLSVLFLTTILVVPLLQCLVLLWQWFSDSSARRKAHVSILIEVLQAWQYAEVYLIAIFVASWQLGPISNYMVNVYCQSLEDTFSEWVYFGLIKEEDAQCFSVESSISGGFYILAAGAIVLALMNTFVMKATIQYFRDQEYESTFPASDVEKQGDEVVIKDASNIHHVPVLFTDTFRWMLRSERTECQTSEQVALDNESGTSNIEEDGSDGLNGRHTEAASFRMIDHTSDVSSHVTSDELGEPYQLDGVESYSLVSNTR